MPADTRYVHALRFSFLNALYDPVVALTSRERRFKAALVDGMALAPGQRLLDVGCGTGTLVCLLGERESRAELHGLDGDAGILARARRKANQRGVAATFTQGLSMALPYPDGHVDHVVSSLFFHHLGNEDKRRTLAEIRRVLRPGGGLHIADWGAAQDPLMRAAFLAIQLFDGFATTTDNVRGRLPAMLWDAGFKDIRVDARMRTMFGSMETLRARR